MWSFWPLSTLSEGVRDSGKLASRTVVAAVGILANCKRATPRAQLPTS